MTMARRTTSKEAPPPPVTFAPAPKPRRPPPLEIDFAVENTRQLRELWSGKRPRRGSLPAFRHFDALELRPWIDNLALYGVERDGGEEPIYRFLRIGKNVAGIDGGDFTGKLMHHALPPTQVWTIIGHYDAAVRTRGPVEFHDVVPADAGGAVKWDKLVLPLSEAGVEVDQLLVLLYAEKVE